MNHKVSKGVIYIVTGAGFTEMAIASAKSVKENTKNVDVHLFTDQKGIQSEWLDGISLIEDPHVRSKVDYIHRSPFDNTLFLDADTQMIADISELFDLLNQFDFAIAHAQNRNHFATQHGWNVSIPYAFPQMNSGVILFKKSKGVIDLLKAWQKAYHENAFHKDQVTLRELLWQSSLRLYILPPEYNIRFEKYLDIWTEKEAEPKILHFASLKSAFNADYSETNGKIQTRKQRFQERWIKLKWIWKELKSLV